MPSADHARLMALLRARPLPRDLTIASRRAAFQKLADLFPLPPDVRVHADRIGGVPGVWLSTPAADPGRVVVYVHGGAYVTGSTVTHRELAARVARECEALVFLVEYRLAPEWPFPAALEDLLAVVLGIHARGVAPQRLALVGDSAGGGLLLAALEELRARGAPQPACGVALCPWTDLAATGPSLWHFRARDPLLDPDMLRATALLYLQGQDPRDRRASPLFGDPRGLPPLLIQCATSDVLHDDAVRYAARARAAGVEVTLEAWPDMVHVWHLFAQHLREGREAVVALGRYVRERTPALTRT